VSSDHQKEDLERQVEILNRFYPGTSIIKDIGGGLNFKKKKVYISLVLVYLEKFKEIIDLYNDRL
jgi:predicted site-specific integrase-resolvase